MTRFCRCCRTSKPADDFDELLRCRNCAKEGREEPRIRVQLPDTWSTSDRGLPDMTWPTQQELDEGYEGELWTAQRGEQKIEVRWLGNHAKYLCRVFLTAEDNENPHEARTLDYPHEVVSWLALWFQNLEPQEPAT